MATTTTNLPATNSFSLATLAVQFAGQRLSSIMRGMAANRGVSDLTRLDRRALADTGYNRVAWDSENSSAIQSALVKIHDW